MKFIDNLARKILEDYTQLEQLVVILPSERAVKYLGNSLFKLNDGPLIAPEMLTIDRWVRAQFDRIIDPTRLLLVLFEAYVETDEGKGQSFETFLTWGATLLSDFNDLDRYMVDQDQIFKNLKSIKELESWHIDEENYSESQLKFMVFWEQIPTLHTKLMEQLKKRSQLTLSQAYRKIAEETLTLIPHNKKYIFAGFNALSKAELQIIKNLKKRGDAEFIIDADVYYLDNDQHEAGSFLRDDLTYLEQKNVNFIQDSIKHTPIDFTVIECSQHTGQIKVAATELAKLNQAELDETLVLLADETLIHSLVKNIPANVGKANITLGLPLQQTPVKSWVDLLFTIQENKKRFRTKALYFKDFQRILNHVFCLASLPDEEKKQLSAIEQDSIRKNKVFQLLDRMNLPPKAKELFELVTEDWNENWHIALDKIRRLNVLFVDSFAPIHEFERTAIQVFDQAMRGFESLLKEGIPDMEMRSFKLLLNQHWSTTTIAFHGNPTNGLQIMGLLETRMIDFKNLIILGLNEGKLPNNNPIRTLIPMDLRAAFNLPSTREKQGLFAHHFYRLLHHATKVLATYTAAAEQIGSNEASRYLMQIELELTKANPAIQWKKLFYHVPFADRATLNTTQIQKTPEVLNRIHEFLDKPLSASAVNKYMICPLDYYYRYLVEFGEDKEVEEEIENNTFGSIIHKTLEDLFKPYAQRDKQGVYVQPAPPPVREKDVLKMLDTFKSSLYSGFLDHFGQDESLFKTGKNRLSYEMAIEITKNVLKKELEFIQGLKEPLYIEQIEAEMHTEILVPFEQGTRTLHFKGYIDRIDRIGNRYRVIDYKTGKVKKEQVVYSTLAKGLIPSFLKSKHAFQLALYCMFFKDKYGVLPDEAKIASLINVNEDFNLTVKDGSLADMIPVVHELLGEILVQMFDETQPFEHQPDSDYCQYCS
jgi:CRISPR/Cas system-associated exonuclease Cas4 (RecB family)